jgi:hypothetical protein
VSMWPLEAGTYLFSNLRSLTVDIESSRMSRQTIQTITASAPNLRTVVFKDVITSGQRLSFFNRFHVKQWIESMDVPSCLETLVIEVKVRNRKLLVEGDPMVESIVRSGFGELRQLAIDSCMRPPSVWKLVQTTQDGRRVEFEFCFAEDPRS